MSIRLKPHNVETYQKVTDKLKESNKVAVIHPTGTGKMYIALKLLEENKGKKAIYVAPSKPILHDVKKNIFAEGMTMSEFPELKRITYQKLAKLTDEEIQKLDADIIILDEFHHCGAPEWGKGVERLLQKNKTATVLGLSATPLRYTDGLRDMADELFENNVASEMTLEEAIERGILPEATYVSTLYGYDSEFEGMQANIDKIRDEEKRKEAQELLNSLRDKLDENTQNLPEVLSEYMQNKSGKYIVFCRNIEDMNEKIEQAQKMFGGVNPNITIRCVSSRIKESDKILTEFEQDNEEGTLKLLYAVDMLNEGYHVKDLDGVVMMRPTFSPTIYTQQLGRALTVGGDKRPVVLDLVNNFDSCKIIEDFAEKMRQNKGNDENGRTENYRRRLAIFDKTKEFREIAEKITELSKRSTVKLEQKIEIFEEFMKTGEELVGNTTFNGYPIGQWAIRIRNNLNRMNDEKGRINPTKEQLEKLESMGILERQIDSTIDEKIDSLVEWSRKYPKIKIAPMATDEELREYVKTDEEFSQIQEEYKKMQRYYEYVKYRKYQGKLNEEQIQRGKEGEIGGVFGYSTRIEELAKKYGIVEKDADYLLTKFGTLDNFYEMHNTGGLVSKRDKTLEEKIIRQVVDIDDNSNIGYDNLYKEILGKTNGVSFYSSEELKKALEELSERERYVIESIYGIMEGRAPITLEEVGRKIGVTRGGAFPIKHKALRKLRSTSRLSKIRIFAGIENNKYLTDKERQQIEELKKDIQLQNGDLSENLSKLKEIQERIEARKREEQKEKIKQQIINGQVPMDKLSKFSYEDLLSMGIDSEIVSTICSEVDEYKKREKESERLSIGKMGFSTRTFNCLNKAGIKSLADLSGKTEMDLIMIRNLGKSSFEEIVAKMKEYGMSLKTEEQLEQERIERQEENQQQLREEKKEKLKQQIINGQLPMDELSEFSYEELLEMGIKPEIINMIYPEVSEDRAGEEESEELSINKMGFSTRTFNCLKKARIRSLADLSDKTEMDLIMIRNLGKRSFEEIVAKMQEYGISFKTEEQAKAEKEEEVKRQIIQRVLEKQKKIEEQQAKIEELRRQKGVLENE